MMRNITTFDLQYTHRFYKFKGVNMVYPRNEIQKTTW